jgi:hypothetical protein
MAKVKKRVATRKKNSNRRKPSAEVVQTHCAQEENFKTHNAEKSEVQKGAYS